MGEWITCFDLGGVLVRICRSWAEACEACGLPLRGADWQSSEHWQARRKAVVDDYQRGRLECQTYYRALSAAVDGLYSPAEVEAIHAAWTREEYPGVRALVRELNELEGVTTACLSNTNHAHWLRLDGSDGRCEYPAVQLLEKRLASHQLQLLKPETAVYAAADAAFSALTPAPTRVVFFDDLPENVEAARRHGWRAHLVDPHADTNRQLRDVLRDDCGLNV